MGTNFYWKDAYEALPEDAQWDSRSSIEIHIGKRSAAGLYCFDCGTTLCRYGVTEVHAGVVDPLTRQHIPFDSPDYKRWRDYMWHSTCPSCGKAPEERKLDSPGNPAGMELGFAAPASTLKHGVQGCSSFTWTLMKHKKHLEELDQEAESPDVVIDEYGRGYTAGEFLNMIEVNCPIQFQTPSEFS